MKHYIDKDALVAEIDKHLSYYKDLKDRGILSKEGEAAYRVVKILKSDINSLEVKEVDTVWHDASEMPKEKKVCLIRYSANDGASTNNFEVVIAEPLTRRFVTRSYPHKTGYQHTIHGENTIKVDEYQDRREYIPFSDIDEWAYIDDLLNLSNIQRTVKDWKEPVSEGLEEAAFDYAETCKYDGGEKLLCVEHFKAGAKWQKQQDQSTIKLAEDHAMLAGMEKMKEEMIGNTVDAMIGLPYENKDGGYTHLIDVSRPLPVGDNKIAIIFKED